MTPPLALIDFVALMLQIQGGLILVVVIGAMLVLERCDREHEYGAIVGGLILAIGIVLGLWG